PRPSWRDSSVMPSSWPARENARSTRAALRTEASRARSATVALAGLALAALAVCMAHRNSVPLCGTTSLVWQAGTSYGLGNRTTGGDAWGSCGTDPVVRELPARGRPCAWWQERIPGHVVQRGPAGAARLRGLGRLLSQGAGVR